MSGVDLGGRGLAGPGESTILRSVALEQLIGAGAASATDGGVFMGDRGRLSLPFSAIVGQEDLKLALILNAINPDIGGLLIRGPKGTGKSTAVYALARLLPLREAVRGCPFGCGLDEPEFLCEQCRARQAAGQPLETELRPVRVVTLPLSIGEDRLIGSIDMEQMLARGAKTFQPGLLAEANRNILYVDEINLLPDHVTDDLLDAASLGWNTVEREGFSIAHPARFVLVGTMNPEEGELRPQLLDRLPLSVTLATIRDPALRVEIARRNLTAARGRERLAVEYGPADDALRGQIAAARVRLSGAAVNSRQLLAVATMCIELKVDGHRPEIIIARTALALASFYGRARAVDSDLLTAAKLTLGHRTRDGGFEPPATADEIGTAFASAVAQLSRDNGPGEWIQLEDDMPPGGLAPNAGTADVRGRDLEKKN